MVNFLPFQYSGATVTRGLMAAMTVQFTASKLEDYTDFEMFIYIVQNSSLA